MKKKLAKLFLICISPLFVIAQDINGFWKGALDMSRGCFSVNNIELQITVKGDSIYGSSYHYYDINNYVKKKLTGFYDHQAKKVFLQEELVTTYKIPVQCRICIKKYELAYSVNTSQEFLKGDWGSIFMAGYTDCGIGPITLVRAKVSAFAEIPEINVDTGRIRLDFYDNGQIDDDSISVRINDQIVLSHEKLGAEPITTFIRVDMFNTFQEVEMIAENLGSIPPNTALLIITAGKKRFELFLSSSKQKSAKVRFLYEK